jgi:Family of unknown function (DUF5947)
VAEPPTLLQILRTPPEAAAPSAAQPATATAAWPAVAERLREYAAARVRSNAAERCEFCGVDIDEAHGHLVEVTRRALLCVCRPCYLLFTHDGAGGARFRAVPTRYALVADFVAARDGWEALDIPIGLAFFFQNSATGRTTAFYPSPAGATESELPLDAWDALASAVPILRTLAADVEALLIRRTEHGVDALIVPIDACYELVGRIRVGWRGLQGGDDLWRDVDAFFTRAMAHASTAAV